MTDWVRLWHDMPTDPKWRVVAKRAGQSIAEVIAVFNFVMVNASANASERGRTHNLFADDIAAALDMEPEQIEAILSAMQGKVLDGEHLTGWEKRQPKREDNSAERAKAWRERKRTQANAPERPETETDTEVRKKDSVSNETAADAAPKLRSVPAPERELSEDGQYYRFGREVLGNGTGGVLTKLKKWCDGDVRLAMDMLEKASGKDEPRAWIAATMRDHYDIEEAAALRGAI